MLSHPRDIFEYAWNLTRFIQSLQAALKLKETKWIYFFTNIFMVYEYFLVELLFNGGQLVNLYMSDRLQIFIFKGGNHLS